MGEYLLGIDIGTSACKIAVFAKDGTVKATGTGDYQVYYPHPGWAEQNPEEWWEAVCDAIPKVLAKGNISPEEIKGIGIDGQSWSAIAVDKDGNVLSIEEKPQIPKSNYAVVGLYFYPNKVVEIAKNIKPSPRGELEITTINQRFLSDQELKVQLLGRGFAWLDTGTHDSLSEASTFIEVIEKRQGLKVACLEGIALRHGWISTEKMKIMAQPMIKNQYGQYLLKVIEELSKNEN